MRRSSQQKTWPGFFPQVFLKYLLAISTMLALVACGAVIVFPSGAPTSTTSTTFISSSTDASGTQHEFCPGSTSPTVTITNVFGNIRVLAGKAGEVAIHETVVHDTSSGYSQGAGASCGALDGKMDIDRTVSAVKGATPPDIDFDVVVPPDATLVMQTGQGDTVSAGLTDR